MSASTPAGPSVPLDERGRDEARAIAPRLSGRSFALVLTSPRSRAVETCRLAGLGARAQVPGRPERMGLRRVRGPDDGRDPLGAARVVALARGAAGGETVAAVGERADRMIDELAAGAGDAAVFAHGHVLRVLAARWVGLSASDGRRLALDPATLSVLGYEHESRVIRAWNESCRAGRSRAVPTALCVLTPQRCSAGACRGGSPVHRRLQGTRVGTARRDERSGSAPRADGATSSGPGRVGSARHGDGRDVRRLRGGRRPQRARSP